MNAYSCIENFSIYDLWIVTNTKLNISNGVLLLYESYNISKSYTWNNSWQSLFQQIDQNSLSDLNQTSSTYGYNMSTKRQNYLTLIGSPGFNQSDVRLLFR